MRSTINGSVDCIAPNSIALRNNSLTLLEQRPRQKQRISGCPASVISNVNDVPAEIYVSWMLKDKEERMPFILDWLQLFAGEENNQQWNTDFVSFVDAHTDCPERLNTLRSRLITGSWWGSFANKLGAVRDQLLKLREASSNFNVHRWIDQIVSQMEQQIIDERRLDANREASYRA